MAFWKQALLCLVVIAAAYAGWHFYAAGGAAVPAGGAVAAREGQGGRRAGGTQGPIQVVLEPVARDSAAEQARAIGTVSAPRSITIYPEVTAKVTEVLFKAGDKVAAGQPLVELDKAEQQVAVDLARVSLDDASRALVRSEALAATKNIAQAALEDARSLKRKAEIALNTAQIALDRRTVRAAFAGEVGLSTLAVGDLVTPSSAVATLDDVSSLKVTFAIPERFSSRSALGQTLSAVAEGSPDKPIEGRVSAIDTRVDAAARTLKLEALLDAAAATRAGIRPGMSVRVAMGFPGTPALALSALSIQWDRDGSYVWKADGETVSRAAINIVERQSGRVLVVSDALDDQDHIVVEGLQRLRPGAKIAELRPLPAVEAPAAPAAATTTGS